MGKVSKKHKKHKKHSTSSDSSTASSSTYIKRRKKKTHQEKKTKTIPKRKSILKKSKEHSPSVSTINDVETDDETESSEQVGFFSKFFGKRDVPTTTSASSSITTSFSSSELSSTTSGNDSSVADRHAFRQFLEAYLAAKKIKENKKNIPGVEEKLHVAVDIEKAKSEETVPTKQSNDDLKSSMKEIRSIPNEISINVKDEMTGRNDVDQMRSVVPIDLHSVNRTLHSECNISELSPQFVECKQTKTPTIYPTQSLGFEHNSCVLDELGFEVRNKKADVHVFRDVVFDQIPPRPIAKTFYCRRVNETKLKKNEQEYAALPATFKKPPEVPNNKGRSVSRPTTPKEEHIEQMEKENNILKENISKLNDTTDWMRKKIEDLERQLNEKKNFNTRSINRSYTPDTSILQPNFTSRTKLTDESKNNSNKNEDKENMDKFRAINEKIKHEIVDCWNNKRYLLHNQYVGLGSEPPSTSSVQPINTLQTDYGIDQKSFSYKFSYNTLNKEPQSWLTIYLPENCENEGRQSRRTKNRKEVCAKLYRKISSINKFFKK
ncbi:hypothetical protein SNEBB_002791 [Seison nebaliae]|nr:hypothetical protein SNEBB_002791 [Seison nebaliae]